MRRGSTRLVGNVRVVVTVIAIGAVLAFLFRQATDFNEAMAGEIPPDLYACLSDMRAEFPKKAVADAVLGRKGKSWAAGGGCAGIRMERVSGSRLEGPVAILRGKAKSKYLKVYSDGSVKRVY